MSTRTKIFRTGIPLLYALLMLYAVVWGFTSPYFNWDMLGYIGTINSWHEKDPDRLYAESMKSAKEAVPDWVYDTYMKNPLSAEAKAYTERLPFYRVKPLYNVAVWLTHQTGVPLPAATWTVSALCFAGLAVLLFYWRPRHLNHNLWLVMVTGLCFLWPWPMASLAAWSTPDALCTLLGMAGLYSWFFRRSFLWYAVFNLLAMLARPDAIILSGPLTIYLGFMAPAGEGCPAKASLGFSALLLATYVTMSKLSGNYGWERWFLDAFLHTYTYPAEATDRLTFTQYWQAFAPNLVLFLLMGRTFTLLVLSALACFCHYMLPGRGNRVWLGAMLVTWACVIVRFALFPNWGDTRYYYIYFLLILFADGELITPYVTALWKLLQLHRERVRNL